MPAGDRQVVPERQGLVRTVDPDVALDSRSDIANDIDIVEGLGAN